MLVSFQNITIPVNIYKGIRNLLESHHIPELIKVLILLYIAKIPFVFFLLLFVSFTWLFTTIIILCVSVPACALQYVIALVDPKQQDSNGLTTPAIHATVSKYPWICTWLYQCPLKMYYIFLSLHQGIEGKVSMLEKKMDELIAENKPISVVLKQLIQALCAEEVVFI